MSITQQIRNVSRFLIMCLTFVLPFSVFAAPNNLIVSGDDTLTYSSYLFELPSNWAPVMGVSDFAHQTGYIKATRKDKMAFVEVIPFRETETALCKNLIEYLRTYTLSNNPSGTWQEYKGFRPRSQYSSHTYLFRNHVNKRNELFYFIDIPPKHVVTFILTAQGNEEKDLLPYLADFDTMVSSFKWTLITK